MKTPLATACLACSLCLSAGPAIRLLETGEGHGDEIQARSGERWLALVATKDGFAWRTGAITIRPVQDGVIDDVGQKTGKEVIFSGPTPLFLLRNWDLPITAVRTAFAAPAQDSQALQGQGVPAWAASKPAPSPIGTEPAVLKLGGTEYRLRITRNRAERWDSQQSTDLVLERGADRQVLHVWPQGLVDEFCDLVWAGDLDGDGKLDLYLYLSDHYNVIEHTLFRSHGAAEGKLVEAVAKWITTGC